jgi:4-azaleucine resistance transporter AzlC
MRSGVRLVAPLLPAAFAVAASFGVLARTSHVGAVTAIVMSATTFAGSAQIAAVSVLGAGGGVAAAVAAALLLNARYAPMGITVARSFEGSVARRLGESQLIVDESWALAGGGSGRFDRRVMLGIGAAMWIFWTGGTAVGALLGSVIGDPGAFGVDGAIAALFLALAVSQISGRRAAVAALGGAAIAAVLTPVSPPGVPILAATLALLAGWRRR